jgi:proteic killer suppression protein
MVTLYVINVMRYYSMVIVSFADRDTEMLAGGKRVRRFVLIEKVARRKLRQLEIVGRLDDLRVPPGNRLEPLSGKRLGEMSIRINDRWRICFTWTSAGPQNVEIVDYH